MFDAYPDLQRFRRDVRYAARSRIAQMPWYVGFARRGRHRGEAVDDDTRVAIEGFPRSANTFAAIAFQLAQERPVKIAHHLHAVSNVVEGVRRGIPTLVLIRPPDDAVLSEVQRERPVSIRSVLAAYARFYEALRRCADGFTIGEFGRVTTDFGTVICSMNERFGTSFRPFEHTDENVALVFRLIDEREARPAVKVVDDYLAGRITTDDVMTRIGPLDRTPPTVPQASVPRPSPRRALIRARLESQLQDPRLAALRRRARDAFRSLTAPTAA